MNAISSPKKYSFESPVHYKRSIENIPGISVIETCHVTQNDIEEIYEVERDMWARGLGEYIKCLDCGRVSGKNDVFNENDLRNLSKMTITQIESILKIDNISCPCCGWDTEFVYPAEYKDSIRERYQYDTAFLVVFRDVHGKIGGFFDGYVSDFDTVFANELEYYYWAEYKHDIVKRIEGINSCPLPDTILCPSALGTDQQHQHLSIIYELMKTFYGEVYKKTGVIDGIYESTLWTNTHAMYEVTWARPMWFRWVSTNSGKTHRDYQSDIFFHPNIAQTSILWLWESLKEFLSHNRESMKRIIKKKELKTQ